MSSAQIGVRTINTYGNVGDINVASHVGLDMNISAGGESSLGSETK